MPYVTKNPVPKGTGSRSRGTTLIPPDAAGDALVRSIGALPLALLGSSGQALQGEFGVLVPPVFTYHRLSGAERDAPTTPYLSALLRK